MPSLAAFYDKLELLVRGTMPGKKMKCLSTALVWQNYPHTSWIFHLYLILANELTTVEEEAA